MKCTCIGVRDAATRSLAGLSIPACEVHDATNVEAAIALNDDAGLLGALSRALGTDLTTTTTTGA